MPDSAPPAQTIRILLADDHDILRQGLKLLLSLQPEINVVGEARTGSEAIMMVRALKPDVVVMDISMPDMDGLEACKHIRSQESATQVLILTMHESEEYFLQALHVGAAGYLVKKAAPTDLHMAISAIAHGGAFLYPGLAKALIHAYMAQPQAASTTPTITRYSEERRGSAPEEKLARELRVLSPRELEVLTFVAEGRTNQEIADRLVISIKTVQAHRANVMEKLGLHDITQLVRFAVRRGLISAES